MGATLVGKEELAIALEDSIIECYVVRVVVAIEGKLKLLELKTMPFFSIALRFLNLADHPIVHDFVSFIKKNKKARV
jgi:hypothetical protein